MLRFLKIATSLLAAAGALGFLPQWLKDRLRNPAALAKAAPGILEPVADRETAALARLTLGLAMGKSLKVTALLRAKRGSAEFFIADLAERRQRGGWRLRTVAFASAERRLFPNFRVTPREPGVKLPVRLTDVPGSPSFAAAYFLTSPTPASASVFFLGGPAAFLGRQPGWRVWCDGQLAAASRGDGLLPAAGFAAFAQESGELFEKVFSLGRNGFSGFQPHAAALALRGRGV